MEHLDPQLDELGLGIFPNTGSQAFLSQHGAPHGPSPGFHTPELSSQARGYPSRPYGYQGPRFSPQAQGAGRPVNIVLPNGGTEAQTLLILSRVEGVERRLQELTDAVGRNNEETKALLEILKNGLESFMSSITIADQQGETPREVSGGAARHVT